MDYKEATRDKMLEIYQQKGLKSALSTGLGMMHSSLYADDIEFKRDLHGEITECILEILIREEIKTNPKAKNWLWSKSLVLKDRENVKSNFLTEIDFVLYTPQCIYLFECKSYAGDKELVGDGLLRRSKGNSCNVYKQSILHERVFEQWFNKYVDAGKIPVYQMCMFNCSNGELVDKRSRAAKIELPCLCINNVLTYLRNQSVNEKVWDMEFVPKVKQILEEKSAEWHEAHLKYVKGLHGGK